MSAKGFDDVLSAVFGSPARIVREVSGGLSGAKKLVVEHGGRLWMTKIVEGEAGRIPFYEALSRIDCDLLAAPRYFSALPDGGLCVASPWIKGVSLESALHDGTGIDGRLAAADVARAMKLLHELAIPFPGFKERVSSAVSKLCDEAEREGIGFSRQGEILAFLAEEVQVINWWNPCLIHGDVRPENFIVCDGRARLIDFENGSLGEAEEDFVYLLLMGPHEFRPFAWEAIRQYGVELADEAFWSKLRFYGALKVTEYALWKWRSGRGAARLQPEGLYCQYEGFARLIPTWVEEVA